MGSATDSKTDEPATIDEHRNFAIDLQNERYSQAAKTSISAMRINFVVMALYIPIISFINQSRIDIVRVFSNSATQTGLIFWLSASITSIFTYHISKKAQFQLISMFSNDNGLIDVERYREKTDEHFRALNEGRNIGWHVTVTLCLSFFTVVLLSYGVLQLFTTFTIIDFIMVGGIVMSLVIYSIGIFEIYLTVLGFVDKAVDRLITAFGNFYSHIGNMLDEYEEENETSSEGDEEVSYSEGKD